MTTTKRVLNWVVGAVLLTPVFLSGIVEKVAAQAVNETARAALPVAVRDGGILRVATALQWAPFAYRSEKDEPVGIDIGLAKIIAAKLGLKAEFHDMKFPGIVPGVASGRYDIGVNQISITPERLGAADMIPYFDTSSVVLVQKGRPIKDIANLCGLTFVVTQGSVQVRQLNQLSEICVAKSGKPIAQELYPSSAETLLAVANGRGDAFLTAAPQGAYISRINPRVELMPGDVPNVERSPAGIVVAKGNLAMRKAVALALASAIEDGSYKKLLDEYGVGSSAVSAEAARKSVE
jgi:polar amino acid transport system substrate-binding protein